MVPSIIRGLYMSAEAVIPFTLDKNRIMAAAAASLLILCVAYSCDNKDNSGPRSPIDTNGTRGSGYNPPGGWGGGYQPKGMGEMRPPADGPDAAEVPAGLAAGEYPALQLPEGVIELTIAPEPTEAVQRA
jgi:hypothetical protein